MELMINGKKQNLSDTIETLGDLLNALEINPRRVAVEVNGEIIDPTKFEKKQLKNKDSIEILSFVGGG